MYEDTPTLIEKVVKHFWIFIGNVDRFDFSK